MNVSFERILAPALGLLALGVLIASWWGTDLTVLSRDVGQTAVLALVLGAGVVVTYYYPVHVRYHTKVTLSSIPLYLIALLLPLPLAPLMAGISTALEELLLRRQRGSYPSDMVATTCRWVVVVFVGAWVAHWPVTSNAGHILILFTAAASMFASDLLTGALQLALMCHEPLWQVISATAREVAPIESLQYLLGILGVLAFGPHIWTFAVLVVPLGVMYVSFKRAHELQDRTRHFIESMADAVDLRDPYTGGHSQRVAAVCRGILRELQIWGAEAEFIIAAARVHDIGKIEIPEAILAKPGALTPDERALLETHPERGAALLARYPEFAQGVEMVRHHHERWDGQGYPQGLATSAIPFGARVIAVADSFDAMTSDRPYRRSMVVQQAVQILQQGRGTQWDTQIVDAFVRSIAAQQEQPSTSGGTSVPQPAEDSALPAVI
jgi:HD-GYP domain-containing protein (c-di-GMP phosphodiesterase class II)